jgi:hypothetical protein
MPCLLLMQLPPCPVNMKLLNADACTCPCTLCLLLLLLLLLFNTQLPPRLDGMKVYDDHVGDEQLMLEVATSWGSDSKVRNDTKRIICMCNSSRVLWCRLR